MRRRAAFLQYLAVVVALAIAVFFAGWFGLLAQVWASDVSHMSSVVAALIVATTFYIGLLSWRIPDRLRSDDWYYSHHQIMRSLEDSSEWCGTAADLSPAIGLIGTIYGLSQQADALRAGGDVLALFGTALYSTGAGVAGFAILLIMSHVLSSSLKRARRNAS